MVLAWFHKPDMGFWWCTRTYRTLLWWTIAFTGSNPRGFAWTLIRQRLWYLDDPQPIKLISILASFFLKVPAPQKHLYPILLLVVTMQLYSSLLWSSGWQIPEGIRTVLRSSDQKFSIRDLPNTQDRVSLYSARTLQLFLAVNQAQSKTWKPGS